MKIFNEENIDTKSQRWRLQNESLAVLSLSFDNGMKVVYKYYALIIEITYELQGNHT